MRYKILILLLFPYVTLFSQNEKFPQYPNPVKIPISLSATFAELRNNAFHAGVDIRTQGVEGKEVFAVADGYVSRIGVSPYGYGKVIYITHNDGFTSVYAHLSKFNKKITDFVKDKQYEDESFAQSIMLEEDMFPIKRGDYLGLTGNSGGSGGPHLHYEIRYTKTQEPVNPLYFGLKIKDTKKPTIKGLAIYSLENSYINNSDSAVYLNVTSKDNDFVLDESVFYVNGNIAFGINVYDKADDANNKNGPYSIELFADNELIFNIISDKYSYSETRYINSLIDYSRYVKNKERFVRTEIDKYNNLDLYETRNGIVTVNQDDTVKMRFVVKDYFGNESILNFTLIGTKIDVNKNKDFVDKPESYYQVVDGNSLEIKLKDFELKAPKTAFYRDVVIEATLSDTMENICSDYIYHIGNEEIPVHKKMSVRIKPNGNYIGDTLLYVASVNANNSFIFLGNKVVGDYIEAQTNVFGSYVIARDTVAPSIKPMNFKSNSSVAENWSLRVEIEDKETGIKDYAMFVNDKWVLADYDAKNKLLMYQIDNHIKDGDNNLKVVVTDMVGNRSVYSTTIRR